MKNKREKVVVKTSVISILSNIVLVGFKASVGFATNSIAIITDAVNNLSDVLSSVITVVGTKLAGKAPDRNHPYGYGRVEYMTALLVSVVVLYAGVTALSESVQKIIRPEAAEYNVTALVILVAGVVVKMALGTYVRRKGREVNSDSLVASGTDALNDAFLSISVLVSAIVYMWFGLSLEAYVGVLVSIFIIKAGFELVRESVDNMLGTRVESGLSKSIKREIEKEKDVQGAYDLVLNDYGPDKYLGSVHIEIADTLTVAEVDKISRRISKVIRKKYGVILHTIGVYSVNTKDEEVVKKRKALRKMVFSYEGILEMHGLYVDEEEKTISFDIIIDFEVENPEELYRQIYDRVKEKYSDYTINITLDVDSSD